MGFRRLRLRSFASREAAARLMSAAANVWIRRKTRVAPRRFARPRHRHGYADAATRDVLLRNIARFLLSALALKFARGRSPLCSLVISLSRRASPRRSTDAAGAASLDRDKRARPCSIRITLAQSPILCACIRSLGSLHTTHSPVKTLH